MAFRADVPVLLASTTLGSAASTITLSSIPSTYRNLLISTRIKSSFAGYYTYLGFRINGDSGANYPNSEQGTTTSPYTYAYIIPVQGTGSGTTQFANPCDIIIYNYASTTEARYISSRGVVNMGSSSSNWSVQDFQRTLIWTNATQAITSIVFQDFSSGSNYAAGSTVTVYGYP